MSEVLQAYPAGAVDDEADGGVVAAGWLATVEAVEAQPAIKVSAARSAGSRHRTGGTVDRRGETVAGCLFER